MCDQDVAAGNVILDPSKSGNVAKSWIEANYVVIAHARPAVPNNPIHIWAKHPAGSAGRGVQYPWIEPIEGQWHSAWEESKLEPWKTTIRDLLTHHATDNGSPVTFADNVQKPLAGFHDAGHIVAAVGLQQEGADLRVLGQSARYHRTR